MTRFVRIQLVVFTVTSLLGLTMIVFSYLQVPTMLGVGRLTVTLELPNAGGLYRFANVTLRGVQVGKVTAVEFTPHGAQATLSLDDHPAIPAGLHAEVRSVSAVGEQYVDLLPRTDAPPYLHDGSVIASRDASVPQPVGPLLDQVSALVGSIPKEKINALLDASFKGFNGSGFDVSSLVDSSSTIAGDLNSVADRTRTLVEDSRPLLDSQAVTTDAIRTWVHSLAGVTGQVAADDRQVRTLLETGPGSADEVTRLFAQVKPTLPVLLANVVSLSQLALTYNPALEQILVLQPPNAAAIQALSPTNNPTGMQMAEIPLSQEDPSSCTVGFLPQSQWRSPADLSEVDTPDGLYCKLPQDSPMAVRGVRNFPCLRHPGKRAPTVQMCDSDKPFEPLAMHQHLLGPGPLDPNLLAQGIPPDDRVGFFRDRIFGPVAGTPAPPGPPVPVAPPGAPALAPQDIPDQPAPAPSTHPGTHAAPSSLHDTALRSTPAIAVARYDPNTGTYVSAGNRLFAQTDLAVDRKARTWQDLVLGRRPS